MQSLWRLLRYAVAIHYLPLTHEIPDRSSSTWTMRSPSIPSGARRTRCSFSPAMLLTGYLQISVTFITTSVIGLSASSATWPYWIWFFQARWLDDCLLPRITRGGPISGSGSSGRGHEKWPHKTEPRIDRAGVAQDLCNALQRSRVESDVIEDRHHQHGTSRFWRQPAFLLHGSYSGRGRFVTGTASDGTKVNGQGLKVGEAFSGCFAVFERC
jgi:hypothetical protein